ncbi:MAG: DUF2955 domain-containing protein [Pseudomonadota bacterium]
MSASTVDRYAVRYAIGITLAAAIAYGVAWEMSWVATLLAAAFLGNRGPRPNLKQSIVILAAMAVIFTVVMGMVLVFYRYPVVLSVLVAAAMYLVFYVAARGAPQLIVFLCVLAIVVFPLLAGTSTALVPLIAGSMLISTLVALLCAQIAHTLVPSAPLIAVSPEAQGIESAHAMRSAWLSSAVILPIALTSLWMNASSAILPLIQVAILSMRPDFSTSAAGGKALVAANLGGGIVALLFYQLLLIAPIYPFVLAGLFAIALMFARGLFSSRTIAPLFGTAMNTVLILIGSGTGEWGVEADAKFYERLLLISFAACYVVGMFSLLQMPGIRERWMRVGGWLSVKLAPS